MLTACNSGYCYGYGLSEVSGWYGDSARFVSSERPWLCCGGSYEDGVTAGIFHFYADYGNAVSHYGFRSILITNLPEK